MYRVKHIMKLNFNEKSRVRTGIRKSWNFRKSFSRPGKSWNSDAGTGKSWKSELGYIFLIRRIHWSFKPNKISLKMVKFLNANSEISKQNLSSLFSLNHRPQHSSEHVVTMKICCRFVNFGPGKFRKRSLKVLEKSLIFLGLLVQVPCIVESLFYLCII